MTRVLAIANQKGGVGKTTTAVNLAASLVHLGKRVMLVDLDPQANATMGSGIDKGKVDATVYNLLIGEAQINDVLVKSENGGFDLLPANRDLAGAEVELVEAQARESRLKTALGGISGNYDFVILDCPPALNLLTLNGLVAADAVMIPMQCEYYALEGLSALVNTIEQIRSAANESLEIEGILRTMFDPRNNLANEVSAQLIMHFGDKVFRTIIPRNIRLAEAPSFGKPVLFHDKESRGALAYLALAGEMIRREEEERQQKAAPADNNGEAVRDEPAASPTDAREEPAAPDAAAAHSSNG